MISKNRLRRRYRRYQWDAINRHLQHVIGRDAELQRIVAGNAAGRGAFGRLVVDFVHRLVKMGQYVQACELLFGTRLSSELLQFSERSHRVIGRLSTGIDASLIDDAADCIHSIPGRVRQGDLRVYINLGETLFIPARVARKILVTYSSIGQATL